MVTSFAVQWFKWGSPSVGTVLRDVRSESKGDFAIKLETLIEADTKTGYMATVKRAVDGEERYVHEFLHFQQ